MNYSRRRGGGSLCILILGRVEEILASLKIIQSFLLNYMCWILVISGGLYRDVVITEGNVDTLKLSVATYAGSLVFLTIYRISTDIHRVILYVVSYEVYYLLLHLVCLLGVALISFCLYLIEGRELATCLQLLDGFIRRYIYGIVVSVEHANVLTWRALVVTLFFEKSATDYQLSHHAHLWML